MFKFLLKAIKFITPVLKWIGSKIVGLFMKNVPAPIKDAVSSIVGKGIEAVVSIVDESKKVYDDYKKMTAQDAQPKKTEALENAAPEPSVAADFMDIYSGMASEETTEKHKGSFATKTVDELGSDVINGVKAGVSWLWNKAPVFLPTDQSETESDLENEVESDHRVRPH